MEETGGLHCIWEKLNDHPQCPHGPTLLFGKYSDGQLNQFYACSVCRDRKLCPFYLEYGTTLTKQQKQTWEQKKKILLPNYNHQKLYIRFNELISESPAKRAYCQKCEKLIATSEKDKHNGHEILDGLTDYQMNHPTEILKPLINAKKEAQYFFSKKSTEDIVNMLLKLGAEQVLCIGTPRIHEYIIQNFEHKISSLLLDIDGRFHNFFGPLSYCWYNLFNHHFFNEEAKDVFKDFITQNGGKNLFLVCDPPFGGRVEPMSQTVKTIYDSHKKWNNITSPKHELKIIFIFPYFMEPTMQKKSNPPGISGGLKDLKMCDYKVDYDNHPLLANRSKNKKQGSSVRIFTNIPLKLLELSEADGYRYCKKCQKWIAFENKHCKKCKECTSKDGRRYRHCNLCERCVKPTWKHCDTCGRCVLEAHVCGQVPKVTGRCSKCNEFGHIEKDCKISDGNDLKTVSVNKSKKRKSNDGVEVFMKKKRKTDIVKKVPKEKKIVHKETKTAKIKKTKFKKSADVTIASGLVKTSKGSKNVPSKGCSVDKMTKKLKRKKPNSESKVAKTKVVRLKTKKLNS